MTQTYESAIIRCQVLKQKTPIDAPINSQDSIGQRIKFILDAQKMSIRKLARALDVSDTNIRNYIDRGSKPSSEVLEKIVRLFPAINTTWLLTGDGEPLGISFQQFADIGTTNAKNFTQSQVIGTNHGPISYTLEDCKKERDLMAASNNGLEKQIVLLTSQLADKERTIQILLNQQTTP